ncbi:MAG: tape measure protein, partial [Alteromonadales bacterium]|nr:tape measure protein [Alteromonadales bacterium]
DVKKGNELFADLQVLASKTPLQIGNITKSAQQLLAAGTQLNDVNETITMLGDIALGDAAKLDTMTRAYSKMQTKGKATMEELNMVTEAGVPILQALGDSMGVSVEKVFELSSKGQIAFSDVKAAMQTLTSETGQFNAGMEKLSQTTAGKFSTAMDNLTISAAEFGVQLLPMVNDLLEGITDLARDFGELDDGTKKVIMTTAAFVAGIGPAIKAVIALKKAFTAMSGPIGIAMLAVTGLVAGISKLNEMSKKV